MWSFNMTLAVLFSALRTAASCISTSVHAPDALQVAYGPAEPVEHGLGLRVRVRVPVLAVAVGYYAAVGQGMSVFGQSYQLPRQF